MLIPLVQHYETVILAHGDFPHHRVALQALHEAKNIVCCDGVAEELLQTGLQPTAIVGDMDSLSPALQQRFAPIIHRIAEQESNDLTKAVNHCLAQGLRQFTLLGTTGKREDHTLGNISLVAQYADLARVQLLTNYGSFVALSQSATLESFAGQQVSVFALQSTAAITARGLKYPLRNRTLTAWWQGALNEAEGNEFSLQFEGGKFLVFREMK